MKRNLFIMTSLLAFMSLEASAQMFPGNIIPMLNSIQKQDMDRGKRLQQEEQKMRDYKNRQEGIEKMTKELI